MEFAFESLELIPKINFSQRVEMAIRRCPVPSSDYFKLIKMYLGIEERSNTSDKDIVRTLTSLSLICRLSKEFMLNKRHFMLLNSLQMLEVHCPGLSQVPSDLLFGLPEDLKSITIAQTSLSSFSNGLISRFTQLNDLNLSENRVTNFPTNFFKAFINISHLNVSSNRLALFDDDDFQNNIQLTQLYMSKNLLQRIPHSICSLYNLTHLLLQENRLVYIQAGCFYKMDWLQDLDLSDNRLRSLEYTDASWTRQVMENSLLEIQGGVIFDNIHPLISPNVTSSGFSAFADRLWNEADVVICPNGYSVSLRNNCLESIPEMFFFGFIRLCIVDLSFNKLSELPPKLFSRNIDLASLDLSNNHLTNLPERFLFATLGLQHLNISYNRIKTLGSHFLHGLSNLVTLDLSQNFIETSPREIFLVMNDNHVGDFFLFPGNQTLNLEGNQQPEWPLWHQRRLKVLNMSRNRLTTLCPVVLHGLDELERFNASHNSINVADCNTVGGTGNIFFVRMTYLTEVDMSHNTLTVAPEIHPRSIFLRKIVLSDNFIGSFDMSHHRLLRDDPRFDSQYIDLKKFILYSEIPHSFPAPFPTTTGIIGKSLLQHLDLSGNRLALSYQRGRLLGDMSYIVNVRTLDLSRNELRLECSPEADHSLNVWGCSTQFKDLKNIEEINLARNEIEFLPMEFRHHLPRLRLVDLRHNKIKIVWYQDFLFSSGMSQEMLESIGYSENDFIRREIRGGGYYYEYPNTHQLTIDLRHNQIQALDLPENKLMLVPRDCQMEEQFSSVSLLLGHNPIVCSCQVFSLLRYALKELRPVTERERTECFKFIMPAKIDVEGLSCSEPASVRGKAISDPEAWAHHLLPLIGICHQPPSYMNLESSLARPNE